MNSSREQILTDLRHNAPPLAPLPEIAGEWIVFDDLLAQFATVLEGVGGRAQVVRGESELAAAVANVQREIAAVRKMSFVPGVAGDVDPADRATPHDLADLDLAVLPGEFAVAENAAVWVTDRNLPARVVYFIPQHVVLVVPVAEIVPTMHAAYERLAERNNGAGEFATPAFGCYISGPSKTADIEQSLVIGAHGARSLTVLFCDRSGS